MNARPVSAVDYIPAQHPARGSDGPDLLMLAVSNLELEEPHQFTLSWPLMPGKEPLWTEPHIPKATRTTEQGQSS